MFWLNRFHRSDDGSFSIEGVIWVPLFVVTLAAIIDLSLVFHHRADLAHTVHQINRAVAVGHFADAGEAQAYLTDRLSRYGPEAAGQVIVSPYEVETRVRVPASGVSSMGTIPLLADLDLTLSYTHLMEN